MKVSQQQKRTGKNLVPPKVGGAKLVEIPPITDFANQSFSTLTYAVEKFLIDGAKFQKKFRDSGSHIHQYELKLTIHNKEYTFFLNLQSEDGKAKTYQAQQFINILKFIKEAKATPNYFKNSSSNQEELLQNFKDQLEDQDSGVEEIFYSLHNLTEFLKKSDGLITGTNDLINDLSAKLTTKVEANITNLSKQQLADYSYLLYKLDVINLKKKEGKNFELPYQLVDKLKQLFTDELETIKEKLGSEFSADYNLVINVDENYYALSIDEENNAVGFSRIEKGAYPVDTEFSYSADETVPKFCSLRSILKQKTDTVSQLRQILPSDDIKTSDAKWVEISYIPLNAPRSIADASGKIVQYSSEFIYTDKELPFELLKSYHNTEIPLDLESKAMANIYPLKSKNNSSSKQVRIECANPQILLKKSQMKNSSGEIVTTSFTTYESNSGGKDLYHFIKGEVPAIFESSIKEVVGNFTVVDVVKYETIIQFKEKVQKFNLEESDFQFNMVEILNLKINKAIKLQIFEEALTVKNIDSKNKFAIEMFKEILESSNTEINEWNVFNIFSTTENDYKQEFINELELEYSKHDIKKERKLIIGKLMSYLGCPRQAIDYAIWADEYNEQNAYVWYIRSRVMAIKSDDIMFCNYRLAVLSKDEGDKVKYCKAAINVENVSKEKLVLVFQCYYLILILSQTNEEMMEILIKFDQFISNNDKSNFMGRNLESEAAYCNIIFISEKFEQVRNLNPELIIRLAHHLNQDSLLGITSKLYLLKNALAVPNISQAEELSLQILQQLQIELNSQHEELVKHMMKEFSQIIYKYAFANPNSTITEHWIAIQAVIHPQIKMDKEDFKKITEDPTRLDFILGSEFTQELANFHIGAYTKTTKENSSELLSNMIKLSKTSKFKETSPDIQAKTYLLICGLHLIGSVKYKLEYINQLLTKAEELDNISEQLKIVIDFIRIRLSIIQNKFPQVERHGSKLYERGFRALEDTATFIFFNNLAILAKLDFYSSSTDKRPNRKGLVSEEIEKIKRIFFKEELTRNDFYMLMLLASRDAIKEKKYISAILKFAQEFYNDNKLKLNMMHKFLLYEFALWGNKILQGTNLKQTFIKCYNEQNSSQLLLQELLKNILEYTKSSFSSYGYDLIRMGIFVL